MSFRRYAIVDVCVCRGGRDGALRRPRRAQRRKARSHSQEMDRLFRRSDAGGDIAARCPYQATRDTSDWLILYERENEIEMGAHAPRVPFSAPSRKTMSAPEDSVNRATRKSWTRGASSNTRGGCGTG